MRQLSAKNTHPHDTCNIRLSLRMGTMCLGNLLFFSTVYSGRVNSFTVANFHKLFRTCSRVKQAGDFPTDFLAMPQFSWEESQECELTTCCSCSQGRSSPKRLTPVVIWQATVVRAGRGSGRSMGARKHHCCDHSESAGSRGYLLTCSFEVKNVVGKQSSSGQS